MPADQEGSSSHQSPSGAGSSFTGSLAGCSGSGQQQQSHSRSRSRSRRASPSRCSNGSNGTESAPAAQHGHRSQPGDHRPPPGATAPASWPSRPSASHQIDSPHSRARGATTSTHCTPQPISRPGRSAISGASVAASSSTSTNAWRVGGGGSSGAGGSSPGGMRGRAAGRRPGGRLPGIAQRSRRQSHGRWMPPSTDQTPRP